jgi:hypothetical protein
MVVICPQRISSSKSWSATHLGPSTSSELVIFRINLHYITMLIPFANPYDPPMIYTGAKANLGFYSAI